MKILLIFSAIVAAVYGCSYPVGVTVVSESVTTTAVSSDSGSRNELVRSAWEMMYKNGRFPPTLLFRFIKTHPEYQKMFSAFADVPVALLMKNGNFLAQSYTIAAALNTIIQALDSHELLIQDINLLGTAHYNRGAKLNMFQEFGAVLVNTMEGELGNRFTPEMRDAVEQALRELVQGISKSLHKAEDVAHPITGMTPNQITNARRVWQKIRPQRATLIAAVFKRLFTANPSLVKSFAALADVPIAALSSNAEFKKQVDLVADRLDNMVATLDNTLQIMGQYEYMGHTHAARGVTRQEFELFGRTFMELLSAQGISETDLITMGTVLSIGTDKIAENLN